MNSDFRVSVHFREHPKVKRLERRLGTEAVLCLITLWSYCAKFALDGVLKGMSDADLHRSSQISA